MHRFFAPPEATRDPDIELSPAETRHALTVLRLRSDDRALVLNGVGDQLLCEISRADRRSLRLRVLERRHLPAPPRAVTLLQALPKPRAMDLIVQKATELGASRIVPLLTERTVIQPDPAGGVHKLAKWRAVAIESVKQCGNPWLPAIESPVTLTSFLARHEPFELALVASLHPGAQHPRTRFDEFRRKHSRLPLSIALFVGPEGDFSPAELDALTAAGAGPITLGPLVLRSETAALACLIIALHETQPQTEFEVNRNSSIGFR